MAPSTSRAKSSKQDADHQAEVEPESVPPLGLAPAKKDGLLTDSTVAKLLEKGVDVTESKYTCQDLFGSLSGAALLDAIYDKFGAGEHDIEWFTPAGKDSEGKITMARTIVRSDLSRPIQESTASTYKQRLYKEGLSQLASGSLLPIRLSFPNYFCFVRRGGKFEEAKRGR